MKIALVHDYLVQYGGAERVLENFCELFPHAPIFTLLYDEKATHGRFQNRTIYTSSLQKWPFVRKQHRIFPLFMPSAIEEFDFSRFDVVLSDSSSFAKGIITPPQTVHICYMHTPMRYAWDDCQRYIREFRHIFPIKIFIPFLINMIRLWDKASANRPDNIIANSEFVARRIKKYYHREVTVIHPPVDVQKFFSQKEEDYFLIVGRLIAYKRHDIVIEAFNRSGKKLKIIGVGPEEKRLRSYARKNIEFLGHIDDEKLTHYYARCRGLLFPQEEDFGIVAVEALASGKPIIAFRGGDIIRHVREGKEGVFFEEQTVEGIEDALRRFEKISFNAHTIRKRALRFDKKEFQATIEVYIKKIVMEM